MLLRETVELLLPGPSRVIVDGTLGGGGHAEALLERGARVIGIDRDQVAHAAAAKRLARFGAQFEFRPGNFADVLEAMDGPVDGMLLDLGVSSPQLAVAERGFSFQNDGPLDMRMANSGETAAELIERLSVEELTQVIDELGEERFARKIASVLKEVRPQRTLEAAEAVKRAVPRKMWPDRVHVATKTFQALRMAVNGELDALNRALAQIPRLLAPGGVAAVITFHSLEDRPVKRAFAALAGRGDAPTGPARLLPQTAQPRAPFELLTPKPLTASDDELAANPRSRSAKLRAVKKVAA